MAGEALARIRGEPSQLAKTIEYAALRSGDPAAHDLMFARVHPDRIETPASSPDATQVSYCTGRAAMYDDITLMVDDPVDALFDIDQVLAWLDWLEDEGEPVTTTFVGDPRTGVTDRLVNETENLEITVPCVTDWTHEEVSLDLPDWFADDHFLGADGDPLPTTIRTDADVLDRLVAATDIGSDDEEYAITVADGALRLAVDGPDGLDASGTLQADVSGPDVTVTVGTEFRSVVSSLEGAVELQAGRGEPLAIVRDHEAYTLRFVVFGD